ncbi:TnsA endonuclease N-terminal domain-containing protein [Endozoicomonas lisbonensis]|uniref:TnsA endonuclease N-terminal domain-containing protein n=1 Tax=Endozoicomonas lisbonensis TaxID=3120522 RepID=A0ABV2SD66_9GAMM
MPSKNIKHSPYSRSEKLFVKWLEKELRGTGSGASYIRGLNINEVPSSGKGNRKRSVPSVTVLGRLIHLMSDLEYKVFRFFDLSKNVFDIREQFPLDREVTLSIAEKLKIGHPSVTDYNTKEKIANWMTTDLLVDYLDNEGNKKQLAVYIKPAKDLKSSRNLQKLIIEYVYWQLKGVRFCIITDNSFSKEVSRNLEFSGSFYDKQKLIDEMIPNLSVIEKHIASEIIATCSRIDLICESIDHKLDIPPGDSLRAFYYMIGTRKIDVELSKVSVGPLTHSSFLQKSFLS